jgi:polyphosphate kinase
MKTELNSPELYINRELSWIEFNRRVLEESIDPANPLLERFRFASIVASNLDEFFMVRVASVKRRIAEQDQGRCPAGMTAQEIFDALSKKIHTMTSDLYDLIEQQLIPQGQAHQIVLHSFDSLSPKQTAFLEKRFEGEIFPVLTPMALDPTHPFPILLNLSLNIGVRLGPTADQENERFALVPIPSGIPRLMRLPSQPGEHPFILLEEVVRRYLPRLFTGQEIREQTLFRVTRDAEVELDDEGVPDLLELMEGELLKRRTNPPVRIEIEKGVSPVLLSFFLSLMQVQKEDVYAHSSFLDPRFLSGIADTTGLDHLRYKSLPPQLPPEFEQKENIWPLLREKDIVLHHPYESFDPVVQMLSQAADDPEVLAIKQTLYRTSGDSPIVRALARAASKGKQVTVLLELMARFDEERNIEWAKHLEKAGAHVIYGLVGLKTHAKILLIVRREKEGIRRYVHLGTGNYNDRTARLYTDIGLMTSDDGFGSDASGFFNTITGYSDPPDFAKLTMAPLGLREKLLHLILREAERAKSGQVAHIDAKLNALVDRDLISALYQASSEGVQIRLAIRGVCCLRPGIKGVSDRITVTSIVDRFLEHTRIYYFRNGGEEEYYCSSADWMPRNLDRRVELFFPIASEEGRAKLRTAIDLFFIDNVKARVLQSDGSYQYKKRKKNEEMVRYQETLYQLTTQQRELTRNLTFKPIKVPPTL